MLQKLSSADVDTIMIKAASALRAQDVRIAELEAETDVLTAFLLNSDLAG
jgi:hypothetical protein